MHVDVGRETKDSYGVGDYDYEEVKDVEMGPVSSAKTNVPMFREVSSKEDPAISGSASSVIPFQEAERIAREYNLDVLVEDQDETRRV